MYGFYNSDESIPYNEKYQEQGVAIRSSNHRSYCVISLVTDKKASMSVFVDDQRHELKRGASGSPLLHCGKAPLPKESYYYAVARKSKVIEREAFVRQPNQEPTVLEKHKHAVHDFYNRTQNTWPVTQLPQLYKQLSVIHRIPTEYHVEGEISTIHLIADQTDIDNMHENNMEKIKVKTKMFYISSAGIQEFEHVVVRVAGRSSRGYAKLSYDLKICKKEKGTLHGFRRLKLRALYSDPSYIREDIAYRTLRSLGLPTSAFSYVRVFMNDQAIGLFGLVESYSDLWTRDEFGYGRSWCRQGVLYQATGADTLQHPTPYISDLRYHGDQEGDIEEYYAKGQYKIKGNPSRGKSSYMPLARLTKFVAEAPTQGTPCTVAAWQRHFNMESVLRSLALEVVAGFSDGYISLADNYLMYQTGPYSSQFVFIPSDLDGTFGKSFVSFSDMLSGNYTTYPGYQDREFMQRVLRVPQFKDRFEFLIKELATELINLEVMERTISDIVTMIREDVQWDISLPRVHPNPVSNLCKQLLKSPGSDEDDDNATAHQLPKGFPVQYSMLRDLCIRMKNNDVGFMDGVNGPTGYLSLMGVKEYISKSSDAIKKFYNL
ncbi:coth protein-domain-containing protein [Fennellomyces sp. T-0311]|nr:coth protein-domain-containing protein [Fennellomyces sp. T-0311]KAI8149870.1 coth protein-domain-containing protein [Fennellomyces sp. T-0311]